MTLNHGTPLFSERSLPPSGWPTLTSLVAVPVVFLSIMWAMQYPALAAVVLLVGITAVSLLRRGGPRLVRRLSARTHSLQIPGVGTVEYRITSA